MYRNFSLTLLLLASSYLAGCASIPMASPEQDQARKEFTPPAEGNAGLYIFRNSIAGAALKKSVYVDGQLIGETGPNTYFYHEVPTGEHTLSTESEFGNNDLQLQTESGQNYFIRQFIKLGVFVGGAVLQLVSEEEGKEGVLECKLGKPVMKKPPTIDAAASY